MSRKRPDTDQHTRRVRETRAGELPKGFTCTCGAFNRFPGYVYAHWRDPLRFSCECGRHWSVQMGLASPTK